jgi:DNA polymerase
VTKSFAALLRWYAEMGVDIAVDDAPHDRFAEAQARAFAPAKPEKSPAAPQQRAETARPSVIREPASALPADVIEASASESASAATSLDDLRERLARFEGCGLKATATQLVFGDGNPSAEIMFVGEAPGADEDRQGVPFVGRAGHLLDKMLAAIGLDRSKVYIANVVPWRPPGNRTPTPLETAACLPFTRRQIELVDPKILVCLGAAAAQTLLGGKDGILRMRGRWFTYMAGDKPIRAIAMLHPAYLLRQPAQKKLAWQDLRMLAKEIDRLHLFPKHGGKQSGQSFTGRSHD